MAFLGTSGWEAGSVPEQERKGNERIMDWVGKGLGVRNLMRFAVYTPFLFCLVTPPAYEAGAGCPYLYDMK